MLEGLTKDVSGRKLSICWYSRPQADIDCQVFLSKYYNYVSLPVTEIGGVVQEVFYIYNFVKCHIFVAVSSFRFLMWVTGWKTWESHFCLYLNRILSSGKTWCLWPSLSWEGPLALSHLLSNAFIVVAVVTVCYILLGCCILLSAQKHPGVCNETRDEQHTVSPYWLTVLSKEDEKSQTEWVLSLLSSRQLIDNLPHILPPRLVLETLFKHNSTVGMTITDFS